MKRFNLAILAFVIAISSAFTLKHQTYTFQFNGSTTSGADRKDPLMYTWVTPSCSGSETKLCSIISTKTASDRPVIASGTTLYDDLYNNNSSTGPVFTSSDVTGKNP